MNESGQLGTYWVHAHANGGLTDGLRAPLVLHPENETYADEYDEEFTVVLSEWYHDEFAPLLTSFMSIANPGGAEPVPRTSFLISPIQISIQNTNETPQSHP